MNLENFFKQIELAEMLHLYRYMKEMGWQNRDEAKSDEWCCQHLDQFGCYNIIELRDILNKKAAEMGHTDIIIREN